MSDDEILARLEAEVDILPENIEMREVTGASGVIIEVLTEKEEQWWGDNVEKYLEQFSFENITDLADLDRLLTLELLSMRYGLWMLRGGINYWGEEIPEKDVADRKNKIDSEIRLLKKEMGMGRRSRLEGEQESVATYLQTLLRRAKEFGVHRDRQIAVAMDLFTELKKLVGLNERSDEEERAYLEVNDADIIRWIREVAIPTYDEIDNAFRKNQILWIRDV